MIQTIATLLGKLQAKKEQEAVSTADAFRRLVRDAVDGKLNADQLESGLALTGRTVQDLQTHAEALVRRRDLSNRMIDGEKAAAELERVHEAMGEANEVYQAALQKFETTYGPLRAKAEELQVVIANGEHSAKLLEQEAGKLDPEALVPFVSKREEVYEATTAEVEEKGRKQGELGTELHCTKISGAFIPPEKTAELESRFKVACAELMKAEKPRRDADAALQAAKRRPELI